MFIKLKDNKMVSAFSPTQQDIILFHLDDDMFRIVHSTFIRPSLQNL